MLASMAEREQFRSPSAAKVRIFSEMAKESLCFLKESKSEGVLYIVKLKKMGAPSALLRLIGYISSS